MGNLGAWLDLKKTNKNKQQQYFWFYCIDFDPSLNESDSVVWVQWCGGGEVFEKQLSTYDPVRSL